MYVLFTSFCNLKVRIIATMHVHPGEKVNIFGCDFISHCEGNKICRNVCLILNGYGDRAD